MSRESLPRHTPSAEGSDDTTLGDRQLSAESGERHSVSDLVSMYGEPLTGARDDPGSELGRSPSAIGSRNLREHLDAAIDGLETRIMTSLSRDRHEFRETLSAEIIRLNDRVRGLGRHVEEQDGVIADLTDELHRSSIEVVALQTRVEDAEMNSRLPCLLLSGAAMPPDWSRPCESRRLRPIRGRRRRSRSVYDVTGGWQPAGARSGRAGSGSAESAAGRGGSGGW